MILFKIGKKNRDEYIERNCAMNVWVILVHHSKELVHTLVNKLYTIFVLVNTFMDANNLQKIKFIDLNRYFVFITIPMYY